MEVAETVFPWLSCGVALFAVLALPLSLRKPNRLRDLQLTLNAEPNGYVVFGVLLGITALGSALLGVVLVGNGFAYAWGIFAIAAAQLVVIGQYIVIARLPFPTFHEDEDPETDEIAPK
ncbi:hypothetical protein ACFSBZ_10875 [Amnibacterium flavum]|uniref:Uncharacterized protein n=1 Tax=Amnibacterium flavum TaxID=2173173 RepID=A0A2V1HRT9_9MICO|nr:hypothetical protein [Amnibacterium flavum]PVZ95336.1 hypothetical protein DDQ50_02100 [Amnibacterium flavum]